MLEVKVNKHDANVILVIAIVVVLVLIVIYMIMYGGRDFYGSLNKPYFIIPDVLNIIILAIVLAVVGYVGVVIWSHGRGHKQLLFTLWITQVALLLGAATAFFNREDIATAGYLLMMFLAVHVAMTYELQHIDSFSAILYTIGAVYMLYIISLLVEFQRIN